MLIAQYYSAFIGRLLALGLAALMVTACSSDNGADRLTIHSITGATMGTSYSVKVVAPVSAELSELQSGIQTALDRIESRMSTYRNDSELSRFNRSEPGSWFEVSEETAAVVALGLEISRQTQGAFDMTVGPLVNLWGFGPGNAISKTPSEQQINEQLARVGYQQISVRSEQPALAKQGDRYLDLSAIAKGYAVDAVADYVSGRYQAYLVEVGGELLARGRKPDGSSWRIAVESPVAGERSVQKVISVEGMAIATSGDYRNYFEQNGVRYSHTIDGTTGKPISHKLASVTILDPSCARADALATAMMVLGEQRGLALAKQLKIPAFFVFKQGQGFAESYTAEFEPYLMQ